MNQNNFSLTRVKECAKFFADACTVGCIVLNDQYQIIAEYYPQSGPCKFCEHLSKITGIPPTKCAKVHEEGCLAARQSGARHIYFCPGGMAYFAAPILYNGVYKASLVGGPLLIVDKEDFILFDILKRKNIPTSHYKDFLDVLINITPTSSHRVTSLAELLFMLACYLGNQTSSLMENFVSTAETKKADEEYIPMPVLSYPNHMEQELLKAIADQNRDLALRLLQKIISHVYITSSENLDMLRTLTLELAILLTRKALKHGADTDMIYFMHYKSIQQFFQMKTYEDITQWITKFLNSIFDCIDNISHGKYTELMYKVKEYLKQNYMKKVTLEEVAKYVYLSPSYFSKVFKEGMNCNFNTYLNNLRVEKSKLLLLNTADSITVISEIVGFEDQSYFTKVFKKITGVTPGRFRETRGKIENNEN